MGDSTNTALLTRRRLKQQLDTLIEEQREALRAAINQGLTIDGDKEIEKRRQQITTLAAELSELQKTA
jgi:hypothetical protein